MAAGYLHLPGSSDYLSTADKAQLDITGDIDVIVAVRADDYSPPTENGHMLNKFTANAVSNTRSYVFSHNTAGTLQFNWSTDGNANTSGNSTVTIESVGIANGTDCWLRVTLDVDNGASGYDLEFWYSQDPVWTDVGAVAWTQLGTTITGGATTSIFASATDLFLGKYSDLTTADFQGRIYGAWLYSGIPATAGDPPEGTLAADPDFRTRSQVWESFPGVDDQANSWAKTGDVTWVAPRGRYLTDGRLLDDSLLKDQKLVTLSDRTM